MISKNIQRDINLNLLVNIKKRILDTLKRFILLVILL